MTRKKMQVAGLALAVGALTSVALAVALATFDPSNGTGSLTKSVYDVNLAPIFGKWDNTTGVPSGVGFTWEYERIVDCINPAGKKVPGHAGKVVQGSVAVNFTPATSPQRVDFTGYDESTRVESSAGCPNDKWTTELVSESGQLTIHDASNQVVIFTP